VDCLRFMALLWEMGGSATGVLITDRNREQCGDGQNNTPMKRWRMSTSGHSGHKGSKQAGTGHWHKLHMHG
jgi:hypothetical protein